MVIDADTRLVVAVGRPVPGNRNDSKAWAESGAKDRVGHIVTIADGGYPGTGLIIPHRKPTGGELCVWKKEHNRSHKRVRARIEHAFARMKTYKILRDCRLRGDGVHHAIRCQRSSMSRDGSRAGCAPTPRSSTPAAALRTMHAAHGSAPADADRNAELTQAWQERRRTSQKINSLTLGMRATGWAWSGSARPTPPRTGNRSSSSARNSLLESRTCLLHPYDQTDMAVLAKGLAGAMASTGTSRPPALPFKNPCLEAERCYRVTTRSRSVQPQRVDRG